MNQIDEAAERVRITPQTRGPEETPIDDMYAVWFAAKREAAAQYEALLAENRDLQQQLDVLRIDFERLKAGEPLPDAAVEAGIRAMRRLVDPLKPSGSPGSYARG
ncbi:MAG: hypothetical protein ACRCV9_21075, partial [Burkholderiaceae bacterium]